MSGDDERLADKELADAVKLLERTASAHRIAVTLLSARGDRAAFVPGLEPTAQAVALERVAETIEKAVAEWPAELERMRRGAERARGLARLVQTVGPPQEASPCAEVAPRVNP